MKKSAENARRGKKKHTWRMFIASSKEGVKYAKAIQLVINKKFKRKVCEVWNEGAFKNGKAYALNQITAGLRCPELWHWETGPDGRAVLETSEATPLLWTQANLWLALSQMERSAKHPEPSPRG